MDVRIAINVGAYGPLAEEILSQAVLACTGAYACPNLRVEGYAVVTNTPPMGAFGGPRRLAHASSPSRPTPTAWPRRSARTPPIGNRATSCARARASSPGEPHEGGGALRRHPGPPRGRQRLSPQVRRLRARAQAPLGPFRRPPARHRPRLRLPGRRALPLGRGLQLVHGRGHPRQGPAAAHPHERGRGSGRRHAISGAGSAAEILGIGIESVSIAPPDTDQVPDSGPSTLSRNVSVVNRLVERACVAIQKRRFRDPLPLTARSVYRVPAAASSGRAARSAARPSIPRPGRAPSSSSSSTPGPWSPGPSASGSASTAARSWRPTAPPRPCGRASPTPLAPASPSASTLGGGAAGRPISATASSPSRTFRRSPWSSSSPRAGPPVKGIGELPFDTVPAAFLSALSQAADRPFSSLPGRRRPTHRRPGGTMTVSFILNGEDVSAHARSVDRLSDFLRDGFGLLGVALGLPLRPLRPLPRVPGRPPRALLPRARLQRPRQGSRDHRGLRPDRGLSATSPRASSPRAWRPAASATAPKIMAAAALLERRPRPSPREILEHMSCAPCRCTDPEAIVKAVQAVAERRARRTLPPCWPVTSISRRTWPRPSTSCASGRAYSVFAGGTDILREQGGPRHLPSRRGALHHGPPGAQAGGPHRALPRDRRRGHDLGAARAWASPPCRPSSPRRSRGIGYPRPAQPRDPRRQPRLRESASWTAGPPSPASTASSSCATRAGLRG